MKLRPIAAVAAITAAALLAGCSPETVPGPALDEDTGITTVRIAATVTPMTDVVEAAADAVDASTVIELVPVSDYVQPNTLLQNQEIEANFVQHEAFMEDYNDKNDGSLVMVQPVYYVVAAFYSQTLSSLSELGEGDSVVIANDPSNAARALQLLADEGVIELDPAIERFEARMGDITGNPLDLKITQVELMQLNTAYDEADAVFNLASFARQIGLTPQDDGIAVEQDERFAVGLVAHEDSVNSSFIARAREAFTSDLVRQKLEELEVPPAF